MIQKKCSPRIAELKELIGQDKDFLKTIVHQVVQNVLEAQMEETLGARNW